MSNISNISLVIIYSQLKLYGSELLTKIDNVKDDILAQLQNENQFLEGEFTELEKEAWYKVWENDHIKSKLEQKMKKKHTLVKGTEITEVERDVIQQYIHRNSIEICGIPESVI